MAVNRIRVIWSGSPIVGGGVTAFYFNSFAGTVAQQGSAVSTFLVATEGNRSNQVTWTRDQDVLSFDQVTGAIVGVSGLVPSTGTGTQTSDPLPHATQGLLRMVTNTVVNGRLLRGRIFIPGPTEVHNTSAGLPQAAYVTGLDTPAAALISDANTDWIVWSQTHGQIASVATASAWNNWAQLRSRRD